MYKVDIYGHLKVLLGRILSEMNEAKEEILLVLDEM